MTIGILIILTILVSLLLFILSKKHKALVFSDKEIDSLRNELIVLNKQYYRTIKGIASEYYRAGDFETLDYYNSELDKVDERIKNLSDGQK